jgi:transcriptional regulator with XRE-family HTH domain
MIADHPLRKWRKSREKPEEKTLAFLADKIGITASHISQIETGLRQPSLPVAVRLSEETGIPVGEFVRTARVAAA